MKKMFALTTVFVLLLVIVTSVFAQEWGFDTTLNNVQVEDYYIDSDTKFLFLDLRGYSYMVIELKSHTPVIIVNPRKVKGTFVRGLVKYEEPGTIQKGPFFLAKKVDILVSDRQQKLAWESKIREVLYPSIVPRIKK